MPGATVIEIVAIDRGHDDMVEAELGDRIADPPRLVRVEQIGPPGRDVAEGAGARADRAQDHYRRVPVLPALADIRTGRLLADGMQAEFAHQPPRRVIFGRTGRLDPDP